MALLDALYAFFQEHFRCGDLDGDRVWMACIRGVAISPRADDD